MARKYPPGVRLLLDLARAGKCGEHAPDEGLARVARATGEFHEDRASSDAFLDLAYALGDLSPAHESNELCARALAEAWRAEYPFRRPRDGDPLDVLLPHPEGDARAALALDRSRTLPRPPVGLARLGKFVSGFRGAPEGPYDPAKLRALAAEAHATLRSIPPWHGPTVWKTSYSVYDADIRSVLELLDEYARRLRDVLVNASDPQLLARMQQRSGEWRSMVSRLDNDELHEGAMLARCVYEDLSSAERSAFSAREKVQRIRLNHGSIREEQRAQKFLDRREAELAAKQRDAEWFNRLRDAARVVDRALDYAQHYAKQFEDLQRAEQAAVYAHKDWMKGPTARLGADDMFWTSGEDLLGKARGHADEVERLRDLFPDLYPEGARRLPWHDEIG